jgi:hypothetical protein
MANLASLPDEMIDMLSESLDNKDILNLRSACCTLRKGTHYAFCNRFLKKPCEATGSRASIEGLTEILCNPVNSPSEVFKEELTIYKPTARDMPSGGKSILPSAKAIDSLLAALPELESLTIATEETDNDIEGDYKESKTKALMKMRENFAPALLKGLSRKGCPLISSHTLSTLNIHDCFLDGAILVKMLLAYKHSLDDVKMNLVRLKDGGDPVGWRDIFEAMRGSLLEKLTIENVFDPGERKYFVMEDNCYYDELMVSYQDWAEVKGRADGVFEGETGYAHHYRTKILFTESHVESGLEKLVGGDGHMLWET